MQELKPNPPLPRMLDSEYEDLKRRHPGMWTHEEECWVCEGTGVLSTLDGDMLTEYRCDHVEQRSLYLALLDAGIGLNYQFLGWRDLSDQIPIEAAMVAADYRDEIKRNIRLGKGLIFYSKERGTGKTLLAVLIAKTAIAQGYITQVVTFRDLVDAYKASWKSETSRYNIYASARLLVIDELKVDGGAEFVKEMLEALVRHRVAMGLPTILTTNLDPDQVRAFGDGVMSLWVESNTFVEITGAPFRPEKIARDTREHERGVRRPVVLG